MKSNRNKAEAQLLMHKLRSTLKTKDKPLTSATSLQDLVDAVFNAAVVYLPLREACAYMGHVPQYPGTEDHAPYCAHCGKVLNGKDKLSAPMEKIAPPKRSVWKYDGLGGRAQRSW